MNNTALSEVVNFSLAVNYTYDPYQFFTVDIGARLRYLLAQPHNIVALILGFFGVSLNILSIMAILKTRSMLTSHYRFIVSLAVSDILIGLTVTGHIMNTIVNPRFGTLKGTWHMRIQQTCPYLFIKAMNTTSLNISLLNLMGMAIDHFLAILKPLHYPFLMNKQRASIMILVFWAVAILCGFSDWMSVYPLYHHHLGKYNYCELVYENPYQEEYLMFAIVIICLLVMSCTYVRMFIAIKQRHQNMGPIRQELQRNKKTLFTTLLILGTFILCWLPLCLYQLILIFLVKFNSPLMHSLDLVLLGKVDKYLYDLLLLNAILDPIIYAIRMREVQFGYRKLFSICYKPFSKKRRYSMDVTHTTVVDNERKPNRMSVNMGSIRLLDANNWNHKYNHITNPIQNNTNNHNPPFKHFVTDMS